MQPQKRFMEEGEVPGLIYSKIPVSSGDWLQAPSVEASKLWIIVNTVHHERKKKSGGVYFHMYYQHWPLDGGRDYAVYSSTTRIH